MSHKSTVKMKINDKAALLSALDQMGLKYEVAATTNGLNTKSRWGVNVKVDVLLKADSKNSNMQAVGFVKNEDGTYEASGDFMEINSAKTIQGESLNEIAFKKSTSKHYAYAKAVQDLSNLGYGMQQDVTDWKEQEINFSMTSM